MNTSDFDYELPPELIAQTPIEPRDASRLLVLKRSSGRITHTHFRDIHAFLATTDLLVMNESRVLPARLKARKVTGGALEVLMLKRRAPLMWEVMVGGKGAHLGTKIFIEGKENLSAVVMEELDGARRVIQFSEPITPLLDAVGDVPLPPYIHEPLQDKERYQTVYAKTRGSTAAPTAGLHFTKEMLSALDAKGVRHAFVTLHVGLDTFAPVTEEKVELHKIHSEWCQMPRETAIAINEMRKLGGRVIAVGTTSARVLETAARYSASEKGKEQETGYTRPLHPSHLGRLSGAVQPMLGDTNIFITPGFDFQLVDAMLTNFHLPRATPLMMTCAFGGRENVLKAYQEAIKEKYRFYSFGDAMLIV